MVQLRTRLPRASCGCVINILSFSVVRALLYYLYFDSDSCSCSSNRISCALNGPSRETILNREDTPPVIIPNVISFSYSLTGLMEKKTLEVPDKLKEENKQEFTRNDKYYASESGNNPTTTVEIHYPRHTRILNHKRISKYRKDTIRKPLGP